MHAARARLHVPLAELGIGEDEPFACEDLLTGERFMWRGERRRHARPGHEPGGDPAHRQPPARRLRQSLLVMDGARDPLWYKDAIIYQLHVKSFFDANDDGFGDFSGLTAKLDYIRALGANTIWLLPFYPSPLRDDGYDIADYANVNPAYGTIDDFRAFVRAAHERGIRVITELVVNHTSDQHPWFQRARRAPHGSPDRDFYVWSDDAKKYAGARIIFTDTEKSNWTWDPDRQAVSTGTASSRTSPI